ncbi:MAG: cupin domain-containing protein [Acidobacteria bacterium]|nr:cupin domain-containing protein [Acidobacteriota bacterium]
MPNPTRIATLLLCAGFAIGAERQVDPTFLHRFVPDLKESAADVTTPTCHYKPIFGAGDAGAKLLRGIARFGEMTVDPGGAGAILSYPAEEQVYVVLDGTGIVQYGEQKTDVRKDDYMYFPPGVQHGIANASTGPCRLIVMGFKIPPGTQVTAPPKLLLANINGVRKETVGGHPPSTLYQLLMGDTQSKRDRIAAGHVLTSLFTMEFASGGTNFPHHHEREEEIYLVLNGYGDMVAGGGAGGIEGRHPAKAGDAYFFRLNCTVGFYSGNKPDEEKARILAVRSLFPFPRGGR